MSIVLQSLRENTDSYNAKSREYDNIPLFSSPTNFTAYDYMNGEYLKVFDSKGNTVDILNIGMIPGVHSVVGKTQSGKTTLYCALAGNIVSKYENSVFYFRDAEKTASQSRVLTLTGWDTDTYRDKLDYVRYGLNHDFIYNDIRRICQNKESLKDKILINTGYRDINGVPICIYPPDVYIIDSLPGLSPIDDDEEIKTSLRSKDPFDVEDVSVNKRTEGLQIAGSNKLLIAKLLDYIYKYNIRIVLVNHITKNTNIKNPRYIKKQLQFLKQDENVAGGSAYLHFCTNILRTEYISTLESSDFGSLISGTRNRIELVKNKNNLSGVPIEAIFDYRFGYNMLMTSFLYILNRRYGLNISSRTLSFKLMPNISFTKQTLWEKLIVDYKENGKQAKLYKALTLTAQRCLFYDFIAGYPDPNKNNWSSGTPSKISYVDGVLSKKV